MNFRNVCKLDECISESIQWVIRSNAIVGSHFMSACAIYKPRTPLSSFQYRQINGT